MSTTRHIGILELAKEFAEAASCIVDMYAMWWPKYFLCGHAIELALKSALKLDGADDKSLRCIGHDLVCAVEQVKLLPQAKFLSPGLVEIVEWLNPYYSAKEFEYYNGPKAVSLPELLPVVEVVNKLIKDLDRDYRARHKNARLK